MSVISHTSSTSTFHGTLKSMSIVWDAQDEQGEEWCGCLCRSVCVRTHRHICVSLPVGLSVSVWKRECKSKKTELELEVLIGIFIPYICWRYDQSRKEV